MQKQCIFRYVLKDAWYEKLYVIEIYDNSNNNVKITDFLDDSEDEVRYDFTLSKEGVESVKALITDELVNFDEDSIEDLFILDGTLHEISYTKNCREKKIYMDNLWAHEERKTKNGMKIVNLIKDVKKILDEEKINTINFKLNY